MLENGKLATLNIKDILPNRFQPRIHFDELKLNELAESIRKYGLIQPIVVRQIGTKYEIIAGERRYKASILANKESIPAILVTLSDRDSEEIALLENIQREDLTPIEEAVSYKRILDVGYITQEELAKKLGKSQVAIVNKLRLLNLDDAVQDALLHGKISERHARSLLKIHSNEKQVEMLNRIIDERLTVKMTDREIKTMLSESDIIPDNRGIETLSTSDKPVRKAVPVASHKIIKVSPPKELVDKINYNNEKRVDTMDIDKILAEAQDINQSNEQKPATDMPNLMQQNPNTVTSPVISNNEPIVSPTEPAIESGKFVTSTVNSNPAQLDGQSGQEQTLNANFGNVSTGIPAENNNDMSAQFVGNNFSSSNLSNANAVFPEVGNNNVNVDNQSSAFSADNNQNLQSTNNIVSPIDPSTNAISQDVSETSVSNTNTPVNSNIDFMNTVPSMPLENTDVNTSSVDNVMSSAASDAVSLSSPEPSQNINNTNLSNTVASSTVSEGLNQMNNFASAPAIETSSINEVSLENAMNPSVDSGVLPNTVLPGTAVQGSEPFVTNIPDDSIVEENTSATVPAQINNTLNDSSKFRQVINIIRNCAMEIEKLGFYIDTDEIDLGEKYQVTFKIDK
ncbi:MAG: ParB/RepB/Spo0J family partition protein [Bacilli bacterium]|nr:ParB/RepB/Spo0J family partition protein [Bacilli bacterium]